MNRLSQRHSRENGGEMHILSYKITQDPTVIYTGGYTHLLCKKKHRKMVWSMDVVAWDMANIVMPAHSTISSPITPSECRRLANSKAISTIGNRNTPFSASQM